MKEHLIIDGYNVIYAWDDLFDIKKTSLESCRDKFLEIISNYQGFKNNHIIVVFDAYNVKSQKIKVVKFDNVEVVYTKEGQKADNYIERLVFEEREKYVYKVVTSDFLEQKIVLGLGGVRMTPEELKLDIQNIKKKSKNYKKNGRPHSNTIMSNVDEEMLKKLDDYRKSDY
jgi:predicted RNA-binding protein with PIN domain